MNTLKLLSVSLLVLLYACESDHPSQSIETTSSMEKENLEAQAIEQSNITMDVAMGFMEAMGRGDMEGLAALMHEDMVWHNEGDSDMPWIGPWEGKTTILEEFFPLFGQNFQTTLWETEDALANGDVAAFFGKMKGILTHSGKETNVFSYALRVKVLDGKIILWNWFEDSLEVSKKYHGVETIGK